MPAPTHWRDRHPITLSAVTSTIVSIGAAGAVLWGGVSFLHTDDEARDHAKQDQTARIYMRRSIAALEARVYRNEAAACKAWRRPADVCAIHETDAALAAARLESINRTIAEMNKETP